MTLLPLPLRILRNAGLPDGRRVDVRLDGGIVAEVAPAGTLAGSGDDVLDLTGFLLLPAPAEPHAHLDKARSWRPAGSPMGDLLDAIAAWREYAATMTVDDVAGRARAQLMAHLRNGTTAVRTHVDLLNGPEPFRGLEALLRVREEFRGLVDVEIVTLCLDELPTETIEEALDRGADAVGGAPHLAINPDAEVERLVEIARRRDLPIDLHTDESLTTGPTLGTYADAVADWHGNASAGHCVRLGTLDLPHRDDIVARVAAADVGIITLPITNLYLQGWEDEVATPRGITALRPLLEAGVRVAAGADNVQDPFNPVGRSDALETASLLVTAAHLTLTDAYAAVSTGARRVMGLPEAGVAPGLAADLLAVRGETLAEVVAEASAERRVIAHGRLVARSSVTTDSALPASPAPASAPTVPAASASLQNGVPA